MMEEVTLVTLVKDGCYTTKRSDSSRLKEYLTHGWEIVPEPSEPALHVWQEPEDRSFADEIRPDIYNEEPEIWPDLDDFEPEPIPEPVAKGRGK